MRKILLLPILALLLVGTATAQEENYTTKGRFIFGTGSGLSYTNINIDGLDDNVVQINTAVSGGYFVMDNLAVGGLLNYQYTDYGSSDESSTSLGALATYYIKQVFVGGGYLLSFPDQGDTAGTIALEGGYALFLNRYISVEPSALILIGAQNNDTFAFSLGAGFSIFF